MLPTRVVRVRVHIHYIIVFVFCIACMLPVGAPVGHFDKGTPAAKCLGTGSFALEWSAQTAMLGTTCFNLTLGA